MTALAHALVAGGIAAKFHDPVTVAALNIGQHFVLDSIPHWDFGTNWRSRRKLVTGLVALADTVLAFAVTYAIFLPYSNFPLLTLAIVCSLLPDWLETPWYIFFAHAKKTQPAQNAGFWERFTYRLYKTENVFHSKASFPLGALTQIAAVAFFLQILRY